MLDTDILPDTASFHKEEQGGKWYIERQGGNIIHHLLFEGQILSGSWVGPRWVFRALTSMSPEERTRYQTHDEYIGSNSCPLVSEQRRAPRIAHRPYWLASAHNRDRSPMASMDPTSRRKAS